MRIGGGGRLRRLSGCTGHAEETYRQRLPAGRAPFEALTTPWSRSGVQSLVSCLPAKVKQRTKIPEATKQDLVGVKF